jgi:D-arabinitol dehydrogenase (NADP+)
MLIDAVHVRSPGRPVAALRSGRIRTDGILTHRFGPEQYAGALAAVADGRCVTSVIRAAG